METSKYKGNSMERELYSEIYKNLHNSQFHFHRETIMLSPGMRTMALKMDPLTGTYVPTSYAVVPNLMLLISV